MFFNDDYKAKLTNLSSTNIDSIIMLYADDYLNNDETKSDMQTFYQSIIDYNPTSINVDLVTANDMNISWKITVIGSRDTLLSKDMTDVLKVNGDSYRFYGNQQAAPVETKQRVIVELFTGTTCQNCPYAESALENLKTELGNKFSYIEYHYYHDPLEIDTNVELYNYYGVNSLPSAIFQGQNSLGNFQDETINYFRDVINDYAEMDAIVHLDSLSYSIAGTNLTGRVKLTFDDATLENLKLKYTVVEKISDVENHNGELCKQVALVNGWKDITATDGFVNFTLEELPETLPDDVQIIVWVQRLDNNYNDETCKAYNVLEKDIER